MKYSEATKQIKQLSKYYSTIFEPNETNVFGVNGEYNVYYKHRNIVSFGPHMYQICADPKLYKLPYGNKLWMIVSELAMTPPDERIKDNKYNVIIGKSGDTFGTMVWEDTRFFNFEDSPYSCKVIKERALEYPEYQFTEKEFNNLIKYIKTLPDGEFQAKVAEHGKTLVKKG